MPRRALYLLVVAVALVLSVEAISALTYRVINGEGFSYVRARAKLNDVATPDPAAFVARTEGQIVLHPYLGYVFNPTITDKDLLHLVGKGGISRYGFANAAPLVAPHRPDTLRVAVFGGSVAALFGLRGADRLAERLQASPQFASRRVEIVNLGVAGYKQPQMLMVLSYVLSLGAEFDIAINIDGFNEVALPPVENVRQEIMAAYPREWANLAPGAPSLRRQVLVGRIAQLREARRERAQRLNGHFLRHSVLALTVWSALERRQQHTLDELQHSLQQASRDDRGYQTRGAFLPFESESAMYDELAELWRRSSRAMDALSRRHGIAYFHFLQPNQYVEDSKHMSAEERGIALRENHPYAEGVRKGYPRLVRAGESLRSEGLRFTDLRFVFAHEPGPVYQDDCCHFGDLGNRILADAIADTILAAWASEAASGAR